MERRLSAIFSADVQGYSRLMGDDEEATITTLTAYRQVMIDTINAHNGRVVDAPGDNLLAEFSSAVDAVRSAADVQDRLGAENAALQDRRKMHFRIGINLGDVLVEGERIYGDGVNIAARIESIAAAGGICVSSAVYEQVDGKLAFKFFDLGDQTFKNIDRPIKVYEVGTGDDRDAERADAERSSTAAADAPPAIAVLPFENRSGDPEQEYFSDGISEDLITDLSKISGLFVISRNSAFSLKGETITPGEVGKTLGVRYMVEGSVRKAGNRVRISAQLVDCSNGYQLWAERYDRLLDDIFTVQDEVIHEIIDALAVKLTSTEDQRVGAAPTENLQAYDTFARAREMFARRDKASNLEARELFERTIEFDSGYAAAYAFLGRTYYMEMINQWSSADDRVPIGIKLAKQAIEVDPRESSGYESLAIGLLAMRQHDDAIKAARDAVRYDPNGADAYITLAETLSFSGEPEQAIPLIEQAMRLNPRYTPNYIWALGQANRLLGNYDNAIMLFKRVLARNPDHLVATIMLAACYVETDQIDKARDIAESVTRLNPDFAAEGMLRRSPYKFDSDSQRAYNSLKAAGLP